MAGLEELNRAREEQWLSASSQCARTRASPRCCLRHRPAPLYSASARPRPHLAVCHDSTAVYETPILVNEFLCGRTLKKLCSKALSPTDPDMAVREKHYMAI